MQQNGLVASYRLNGRGGGEQLDWEGIANWRPDHGVLWVHLDRDASDSRRWLQDQSGLDPLIVESLLAESTRPRCVQVNGGVMLFLRGVNLNPGADPEDMVSIRLWIDESDGYWYLGGHSDVGGVAATATAFIFSKKS